MLNSATTHQMITVDKELKISKLIFFILKVNFLALFNNNLLPSPTSSNLLSIIQLAPRFVCVCQEDSSTRRRLAAEEL